MNQKVEISPKTIVFTVLFLIFLKVIWDMKEMIFALFLAFILMSALKPVVNRLVKFKIPRILAVAFSVFSTVFFIGFLISFALPPLVQEIFIFIKNLPAIIKMVIPTISPYLNFESFNKFIPEITQNTVGVISGIFNNYYFVVSVIFFSFYFLLEEKFLVNFLAGFLPEKNLQKVTVIFSKVEKRMSYWMWGELVLMTLIGTLSYIGLVILGVKYAFSLAVIAGLLEIVPVIGPVTSVIPAFIVGASTSWFLGLSVLPLYFLIQQLENNVIIPIVMQKAVGIHPIMTLIALTVGGKFGGFLGVLLSVPAALMIETIAKEIIQLKNNNS